MRLAVKDYIEQATCKLITAVLQQLIDQGLAVIS
jgi:hypothetical protein